MYAVRYNEVYDTGTHIRVMQPNNMTAPYLYCQIRPDVHNWIILVKDLRTPCFYNYFNRNADDRNTNNDTN